MNKLHYKKQWQIGILQMFYNKILKANVDSKTHLMLAEYF